MISLDGISKSFSQDGKELEIIFPLTLNIERGEFLALMGPSGTGKSTLLNIIGCLIKPTTGKYLLEDVHIHQLTDRRLSQIRSHKIGFVFQMFHLLPGLTALENVILPVLYNRKMSHTEYKAKARNLLETLGLADRLFHKPDTLSGGQQQRVAIARALINDPSVLIADEPTDNLDATASGELLELLLGLNHIGTTIIMATHSENVAKVAKRVVSLDKGCIVSDRKVLQ